jgi:hypothetical protein
MPRVRESILLTALALAAPAFAQNNEVSIDLTGVRIANGQNQFRSSAPNTIDPATRYRYEIDGMVRGRGLGMGTLFPNPIPLADALEQLAPGSSEMLQGIVCNPSGAHPVEVLEENFEFEGDIAGIQTTFKATFSGGIDASDIAYFSLTNVVISPSLLVGSLEFTEGEVIIRRVTCYPDCDGDGALDFFDFLCFQNAFLAGDPYADCDCDGTLDFFDFLCFQNEFLAACP